jgi:hypothetical protein
MNRRFWGASAWDGRSLMENVCKRFSSAPDRPLTDAPPKYLFNSSSRSGESLTALAVVVVVSWSHWETAGHFLKGKSRVERGEFAQGLPVPRDASETSDRTGWRMSHTEFKGALALRLAGTGRLDEALVAADDAMGADREGADGRGWYAPELRRIKGEVLLGQAAYQSALAAEDCFDQAAKMAREQGALFWELRVALSVARLRVSQGRHHEARALLASVYRRLRDRGSAGRAHLA